MGTSNRALRWCIRGELFFAALSVGMAGLHAVGGRYWWCAISLALATMAGYFWFDLRRMARDAR